MTKILDFVNEVRAPTSYAVGFKKHVGPNKLFNMKSHDHHIMIQHILPSGVWNLLHPGPRKAIIHLGKCFQKICTKVLNPNDNGGLWSYVAKTFCILEMWWPLVFFDFMTHFIIHLVHELEICGQVIVRWCYPIEWYMYVLRKYVRNKAKLEACMASNYMYDETLGFCTEYFALYPHTRCHIWDASEKKLMLGRCWLEMGNWRSCLQ